MFSLSPRNQTAAGSENIVSISQLPVKVIWYLFSVYERGIKLSLSFVRELKDEENYMKSGCWLLAVLLKLRVSVAEGQKGFKACAKGRVTSAGRLLSCATTKLVKGLSKIYAQTQTGV